MATVRMKKPRKVKAKRFFLNALLEAFDKEERENVWPMGKDGVDLMDDLIAKIIVDTLRNFMMAMDDAFHAAADSPLWNSALTPPAPGPEYDKLRSPKGRRGLGDATGQRVVID